VKRDGWGLFLGETIRAKIIEEMLREIKMKFLFYDALIGLLEGKASHKFKRVDCPLNCST